MKIFGLEWEPKIGPAALVGAVQVLIVAGGGIVFVERLQDGIDTLKQQVVELRLANDELRRANAAASERVTRVEEHTEFMVRALDHIEKKVDTLRQ